MIKDGGIMLTQKEWLDILMAKTGCSKKEAKTVLSCSFEYIKELLNEDNPIRIQNFGVFKIKKVKFCAGKRRITRNYRQIFEFCLNYNVFRLSLTQKSLFCGSFEIFL